MNFSFGSDPEFVITHRDKLRSAIGILPKKEEAIADKHGHKYYYDNVLAEIAVNPGENRDEVIENVSHALQKLAQILRPAQFEIRASANYPESELEADAARIAGCNPEWDVYSLKMNEPPENVIEMIGGYYQFKVPFRTAGGHIHIGAEKLLNPLFAFNVVRMMDLFLGIPSIFLDTDKTSKDRRKAYGLAGSHRIPEYGIEYRSLGNFWFSSPEHVGLIYDLTAFVLNFVEQNMHERFWSVDEEFLEDEDPSLAYNCFGYDVKLLCKCINNCDKKMGEKFMIFINNYLPSDIIDNIEKLSGQPLLDPYEAWNIK